MRLSSTLLTCLAAGTLTIGVGATRANAANFIPQQEGEINVGFENSLDPAGYLDTSDFFTVDSLVDSTTGTKSRLFVDKAGTPNTYGNISFQPFDAGTAETIFGNIWLRSVALQDATTPFLEEGQLEVGTFEFTFNTTISKLLVSLFDVEDTGTKVLAVNGQSIDFEVPPGEDKNIFSTSFTDVSSITLKLGNAQSPKFATGDGVLVAQLESVDSESVPEPGVTLGLLALVGGTGLMKLRRRYRSQ